MHIEGLKERKGTLRLLNSLLEDDNRKVHGVFYTNSFFSQRYLCRSHVMSDRIDTKNNEVKLTITTRLEKVGLMEIESTLEALVEHKAGDLPGFTPESYILGDETQEPSSLPSERLSVSQNLFSVDLLLIMKEPDITYQEFTIAGDKFTLVNIHHKLTDYYEQEVTLLFGKADKLYFFSHLYDKDLTVRDTKLILNLLVDNNITGKAITGVRVATSSGFSSSLFPVESLISSYTNASNDIIFTTGTSFILIPRDRLHTYKLKVSPASPSGSYKLDLEGKRETISIYME